MIFDRQGANVEVSVVSSRREDRAFCEFPYMLYKSDPLWVPPLRLLERERWRPSTSASLRYRWVRRYIARRNGGIVGRLAAIQDPVFAERWEPESGFFGFFECAPDQEAAKALLSTAERDLRERGVRRVFGPVNLTTHDETGVLVSGFESPPMVLLPYNFPYYAALIEGAGYTSFKDNYSYLWTPANQGSPSVQRLVRAAIGTAKVRIRPLDLRRHDAEARIIFDLFNASFMHVWGVIPVNLDELEERTKMMRSFVDPRLVLYAETDGKPVGVVVGLPDINEILSSLGGRLLPFGWIKLRRGLVHVRNGRGYLMAVQPEHAGRGIGAILLNGLFEAAKGAGLERLELSLIQSTNQRIRRVVEAFGCQRLKTFRLYQRQTG
jgi:GNAT superfamily N-acetyltransferase